MELQNDILRAVDEHLPGLAGKAVRQQLEELEEVKRELEIVTAKLKRFEDANERIAKERNGAFILLKEHKAIDERTMELEKRERAQDVFELKAQLSAEQSITQMQLTFLSGLVRNTEYRKDVFQKTGTTYDNDGRPFHYQNGGSVEVKVE